MSVLLFGVASISLKLALSGARVLQSPTASSSRIDEESSTNALISHDISPSQEVTITISRNSSSSRLISDNEDLGDADNRSYINISTPARGSIRVPLNSPFSEYSQRVHAILAQIAIDEGLYSPSDALRETASILHGSSSSQRSSYAALLLTDSPVVSNTSTADLTQMPDALTPEPFVREIGSDSYLEGTDIDESHLFAESISFDFSRISHRDDSLQLRVEDVSEDEGFEVLTPMSQERNSLDAVNLSYAGDDSLSVVRSPNPATRLLMRDDDTEQVCEAIAASPVIEHIVSATAIADVVTPEQHEAEIIDRAVQYLQQIDMAKTAKQSKTKQLQSQRSSASRTRWISPKPRRRRRRTAGRCSVPAANDMRVETESFVLMTVSADGEESRHLSEAASHALAAKYCAESIPLRIKPTRYRHSPSSDTVLHCASMSVSDHENSPSGASPAMLPYPLSPIRNASSDMNNDDDDVAEFSHLLSCFDEKLASSCCDIDEGDGNSAMHLCDLSAVGDTNDRSQSNVQTIDPMPDYGANASLNGSSLVIHSDNQAIVQEVLAGQDATHEDAEVGVHSGEDTSFASPIPSQESGDVFISDDSIKDETPKLANATELQIAGEEMQETTFCGVSGGGDNDVDAPLLIDKCANEISDVINISSQIDIAACRLSHEQDYASTENVEKMNDEADTDAAHIYVEEPSLDTDLYDCLSDDSADENRVADTVEDIESRATSASEQAEVQQESTSARVDDSAEEALGVNDKASTFMHESDGSFDSSEAPPDYFCNGSPTIIHLPQRDAHDSAQSQKTSKICDERIESLDAACVVAVEIQTEAKRSPDNFSVCSGDSSNVTPTSNIIHTPVQRMRFGKRHNSTPFAKTTVDRLLRQAEELDSSFKRRASPLLSRSRSLTPYTPRSLQRQVSRRSCVFPLQSVSPQPPTISEIGVLSQSARDSGAAALSLVQFVELLWSPGIEVFELQQDEQSGESPHDKLSSSVTRRRLRLSSRGILFWGPESRNQADIVRRLVLSRSLSRSFSETEMPLQQLVSSRNLGLEACIGKTDDSHVSIRLELLEIQFQNHFVCLGIADTCGMSCENMVSLLCQLQRAVQENEEFRSFVGVHL